VEELGELVADRKLAGQLYDHWLKRRQQLGGPLLERLWFEVGVAGALRQGRDLHATGLGGWQGIWVCAVDKV
jgi:hypothetical protein